MEKSLLDEQSPNTNEWTPDPFYHDLYNDLFYRDVIFPEKKDGYYVEIGALDGMIMSQSYLFEKQLNWKGIVVEPNPVWKDALFLHRNCNISTNAISDKIGKETFECREIPAFSGLKSTVNDVRQSDIINEFDIETITLSNLFDKFNAPNVIDWVSIDTEGAEIGILNQFFLENTKYKINLLSFETFDMNDAYELMKDKPYVKIKNPYLDFMRICSEGLLKLNTFTGELYRSPFKEWKYKGGFLSEDLRNITFEHYYIHMDYLKDNLHLKKLLL
jgi:FkbM family methyltransferase